MTGDDPGHASAVAETLAQATDEELEAAGIDPDRVDDEDDQDDVGFEEVADVDVPALEVTDMDFDVEEPKVRFALIDEKGEIQAVDPRNSDPDVVDLIDERYTTAVADGSDIMGTLHLEGQELSAGVRIDVQRLRELVDLFEREFDEDQRHAFLSFVKHEQDKPILTALRPTGYDQDAAVLVGPNGGDRQ